MKDDTGVNEEKLWLDAEFRRQYPLTTQRLKEAALQRQVDLGYERYTEVLRSLRAAAELSKKELAELSEKEGVLELIAENHSEEDDLPQPSPEEASKPLEGV
jgi:ribosome-binding protein aMBF1 (putative translation factor)